MGKLDDRVEAHVVTVRAGRDTGPGRVLAMVDAVDSDDAISIFLTVRRVDLPRGVTLQAVPARLLSPPERIGGRSWILHRKGVYLYPVDVTEEKVATYVVDLDERLRNSRR